MSKIYAIIVAAGKGERMLSNISKQFLLLSGKPILLYSLELFDSLDEIEAIVLVVASEDFSFVRNNLLLSGNLKKKVQIVQGGSNRQQSVLNGLTALDDDADFVMIHDGARPLISRQVVLNIISESLDHDALAVGVPVKDTIKIVDSQNFVVSTPKREELWIIQTPQMFRREVIFEAHVKAMSDGFIGTDDCILVERLGHNVKMIKGSYHNIKITTPEDLVIAQELINNKGVIE